MKKTIKVTVLSDGQKYFPIYKVMCVKPSGETVVYAEFLNYEMALESKHFADKTFNCLYRFSYITESLVWC